MVGGGRSGASERVERRGEGHECAKRRFFSRLGLARLTLKDGGNPMGEKETSKKDADGGRGVGRWMEGGASDKVSCG